MLMYVLKVGPLVPMPSLITWTRTSWPRLKMSWISGLGRPAPGRPDRRRHGRAPAVVAWATAAAMLVLFFELGQLWFLRLDGCDLLQRSRRRFLLRFDFALEGCFGFGVVLCLFAFLGPPLLGLRLTRELPFGLLLSGPVLNSGGAGSFSSSAGSRGAVGICAVLLSWAGSGRGKKRSSSLNAPDVFSPSSGGLLSSVRRSADSMKRVGCIGPLRFLVLRTLLWHLLRLLVPGPRHRRRTVSPSVRVPDGLPSLVAAPVGASVHASAIVLWEHARLAVARARSCPVARRRCLPGLPSFRSPLLIQRGPVPIRRWPAPRWGVVGCGRRPPRRLPPSPRRCSRCR